MFSNEKFYVTNHDYFNTGGGCMVSLFTVYDRQLNATRYVVANDEGFNYATADTISCAEEFEHEELERIIIYAHDWDALTCEPAPWDMLFEDDEWKLFKYCQFEFYKKDCKHHKYTVQVPVEWLPPELYDTTTPALREWLHANDAVVETDGTRVIVPDAYIDWTKEQSDKKLQEVKDFKQWFEESLDKAFAELNDTGNEQPINELYDSEIELTFRGRSIKLHFDARTYESVSSLLKEVIEDW